MRHARLRAILLSVACSFPALLGCGDDSGGADSDAAALSDGPVNDGPPGPDATATDPLLGHGEVELIQEGFQFTEGPQWMPDEAVLLFSDVSASTIFQVDGDAVTVFRMPSNESNGLAVDPDGLLIAAEGGARRVTRTESDGTITTLAERFEGNLLSSPNDIAVRSDGTIYFTDPIYGLGGGTPELDFRGVFRIAPNGDLTAEHRGDTSEAPNGAVLSPDERLLYVSDSETNLVHLLDVAPDGTLSGIRTFVTPAASPDGMAMDAAGNLFVSTVDGIEAFAPDGTRWGAIPVPRQPANCAFGGSDHRTLYITAREALYRVTLTNPGLY